MDAVTIRPPYAVENCVGKDGSAILDHVKKIVSVKKIDFKKDTFSNFENFSNSPFCTKTSLTFAITFCHVICLSSVFCKPLF